MDHSLAFQRLGSCGPQEDGGLPRPPRVSGGRISSTPPASSWVHEVCRALLSAPVKRKGRPRAQATQLGSAVRT